MKIAVGLKNNWQNIHLLEIMFNVGVHMLSLAGEHLLVQICFMFFISFGSVVVCVGSSQHCPEGKETPRLIPEPKSMVSTRWHYLTWNRSVSGRFHFRRIQLVLLMGATNILVKARFAASLKRVGEQLIKAPEIGVNQHHFSTQRKGTSGLFADRRLMPFRWTHRLKQPTRAHCSHCSTAFHRLL